MSVFLIAVILIILVLVLLSRTPQGFVTPGMGLLLKASALQARSGGERVDAKDALARRASNGTDIAIVDGKPDPADGVIREDMELNLAGRKVPARLYRPGPAEPQSIIVSFHGGGFVVGSLDTNERLARDLCRLTGSLVLSVAYRLAPEHRFPAAHDDAFDSFVWVQEAQAAGRLPLLPIWVEGDSAGANLAAAVCFMARSRGVALPAGQLLLYPVTDISRMDTASYRLFEKGFVLTKEDMEWFRDQYLSSEGQRSDPRVSPLLEPDLAGLPPALVLIAGKDVLRDEGAAYAARLKGSGVHVELHCFSGLLHGFAQMRRFSPTAWRMPKLAGDFMKKRHSV